MKSKFKSLDEDILKLSPKYTVKEIVTILGVTISRVNKVLNKAYVPKYPLDEMVRDHIEYVLKLHDGNKTRAARDLGISLRCLRYRCNGKK
jgi:transcriptional regulator with PAS, ATPase and Fis domain